MARAIAGLLVGLHRKNAVSGQHPQSIRKEIAWTPENRLEVGEARHAVNRLAKNQNCPFLADYLKGASDGAIARVMCKAIMHRAT